MSSHANAFIKELANGFDAFSVRLNGRCMEPAIADQSVVALQRKAIYWPGDIVTFYNSLGQMVCHRFLGYAPVRRGWVVLTRADRETSADPARRPHCILGKVISADQHPVEVPLTARLKALGRWLEALVNHLSRRARRG